MGKIAGRFARVEPPRRVRDLVVGRLSDLPRKNCWSIAEWAGEASPDGMQHLLGRARWDADRVRDDVREYVLEPLGDEDAVLVVDETGDVKKGTHTAGVQRQYTGTAGRIENAQVAVHLVYAGLCRVAGLGEDTVFAIPRSHHRRREAPRGHPDRKGAAAGLAEALGRGGRQGAPLLRLGRHRPGRTPARLSVPLGHPRLPRCRPRRRTHPPSLT